MYTLENLEGVKKKKVSAEHFSKAKEVPAIIANGNAATTAAYNGAINVWKDDKGNIRCESMRYLQSLDKETFSDINEVVKWCNIWLRKIK